MGRGHWGVLVTILYSCGAGVPNSAFGSEQPAVIGDSCRSGDASIRCLALKYVVYMNPRDPHSPPVVSQAQAVENVRRINSVWSQCRIGFQIEQFLPVIPSERSLKFRTADSDELDGIRAEFEDPKMLLVVTTGNWDRNGTLGKTGANAWTPLPGYGPFGAILERPVGAYPNIIAHELGHYLNLGHAKDAVDLMNPVIYKTSTRLSSSQCEIARAAAAYHWGAMHRYGP